MTWREWLFIIGIAVFAIVVVTANWQADKMGKDFWYRYNQPPRRRPRKKKK